MIVEFLHLLAFYALGLGVVAAIGPKDALPLQRAALAPALGMAGALVIAFLLALAPGGYYQRWSFDLALVLALAVVWSRVFKRLAFQFPDLSTALIYAIVPALLVGLWGVQEVMHIAVLTYDSHRFVGFATAIADNSGDLFVLRSLSMATGYPLPLALGHSMGVLWEADYFRLLSSSFTISIIMCIPAVLLIYTKELGLDRREQTLITASFTAIVLTTGTVLYFTFYINSNMPTAAFLLSAATALWFYLRQGDQGWLPIAGLLVVLLGTMRLEAPLIAILLLTFAMALRSENLDRSFRIFIFATSGALFAWLAFLYLFASGGSIVDPNQLLGMMLILACLPIAILLLDKIAFLQSIGAALPALVVLAFASLLVLFCVLRPDDMFRSFMAMGTNMFWRTGMWTGAWPGMLIFSVLLLTLGARIDQSALFFGAIFLSVLLLIFDLAFFRAGNPYRIGFGDSGNRMLLHIVPLGWLTIGLISAHLWADRKNI